MLPLFGRHGSVSRKPYHTLILQADALLCSELKLLYVLITRAKYNVLFHEQDLEKVRTF